MTRILFIWLIQALLLAGFGRLVQAWLWKDRCLNLWETIWFGMACVLVVAQGWHFFLPINIWTLGLVAILGVAGLPQLWRERGRWQVSRSDLAFWCCVVGGLALLIAAHTAVRSIPEGDTRLYHLNVVRWNNEYAVVPGLANLHQRFGVNSTWLLYASLADIGWADGRSAWLVSGLPLLLVLAQWCGVFIFQRGARSVPSKVYCLLSVPFLLEGIEWSGPSLYYDKPPLLVLLVVGLHSLRTPWMRRLGDAGEWVPSAAGMLMLSALAFTLKASCAIALMMASVAIMVQWWFAGRRGMDLVKIGALPTALVVGYMVTNLITSGWPLFPAAVGGLPFDWAQPTADVKSFYQVIADWARLPGSDGMRTVREGFWTWWPLWVHKFSKTAEHAMALVAAGGSCLIVWRSLAGDRRIPWRGWAVLWMVAFAESSVLFWMCCAPDLRFGDGLFYLWLGLVAAIGLPLMARHPQLQLAIAGVTSLGLIAWVKPSLLPNREFFVTKVWVARAEATQTASAPGAPDILVPADPAGSVGDCPLPASPSLDKRLRLRVPGNLGAGFRLEPKQ